MLIDPLVLKKKLNRMATEQGAFAVLSSLLLYVTELAACDPQLSSKRTKWAEGKESKVSYRQACPDPNRGQHPTRFQLLRSRFLNNNREPYTKKRREVGKLVIKEKLWVSRAGNKLDRSKERKEDGKAPEEDEETMSNDRVKWNSMNGKNTVKNILKKFLAAEEKEAKEKSLNWKKKEPNSSLPKIVNKNSVLSKLKEQFEQSSLCSAAEVKASLLRKGEKKTKNFPSRKLIRKPEVRVLRTAAMTTTDINSPASQYLVCSTVPVPRLSMATEINHPWSWSTNNAIKKLFDTPLKEKGESHGKLIVNKTLGNAAQDREDKEQLLVAPKDMLDAKNSPETKMDSTKQGPDSNPHLDSSLTAYENSLADWVPPLSQNSLDCDGNNVSAGLDASSPPELTNAVQNGKEPSNLSYTSTAEGSHEQSPQDIETSEIPEIIMYVYSPEEADTEVTEPDYAGQKCFPEQKALENSLPFHFPGVQATHKVEPPTNDQHLTLQPPVAGKRPPEDQRKAKCSEVAKGREKSHSEDKIFSVFNKNDSNVPAKKEQDNKTPNCPTQNESKGKEPHPHQTLSPQIKLDNSNTDIPNSDVNQTKHTLSSNESQEEKPSAAEEDHISSDWKNKQSPLPSDLVKHNSYTAEEDFEKDRLYSLNEMVNHANNQALGRSTFTDLETCQKPFSYFMEHEEGTADEMPWPDSRACQASSSNPLTTPVSGIAGQRIHYTFRNPPTLPPIDLVNQEPGTRNQETGGVEDEHASHDCEKHQLPSLGESTDHGNDSKEEKKTAPDFENNQMPSSSHVTEHENTIAKETNTCQSFENYLSLSTKKQGKHENKIVLKRKSLSPLEKNQAPTSDDTTKHDTNKVSKYKKHKLLSSDDDMKHQKDRTERNTTTGERDVLCKSEMQKNSAPSDTMCHDDNTSNEKNSHSPDTSPLPLSEHDTNIQGGKNKEQGLKCLMPSRDLVKHEHDMAEDENICYNNEKHHLYSSNEPMKRAHDTAGERNIKSNFKTYSTSPRNTAKHDDKTTDEKNTSHNLKNEPMQRKTNCGGETNTSCDPKNQIPSSNPLVKQDKEPSPLEMQNQMSPGDFVKHETKSAGKKTKRASEKAQSPSSNKLVKPQERSTSGERKQKTPSAEDARTPETKAVKEDNKHQHSGKYHQSPPSSKSVRNEKNTPEGEKQQTMLEVFRKPDTNAAKEKNKDPGSRKYRSTSSETLAKPQDKNTPEQKQQTSASTFSKKPGTNDVKLKDKDPNSEKSQSPSSNKPVKSQEQVTFGERKQKPPAAEDIKTLKTKAVKEDDKHQHSGKYQSPPSNKSVKCEEIARGGEKQQTVSESFTEPDATAVKEKNKDTGSGMCQSPSSNSLVKPQERKSTAEKQQSTRPSDENITYKAGSPEKKSGPRKTRKKYQLFSSNQTEKHGNESTAKESSAGDFKSYQAPQPSDGIKRKSDTAPKETVWSDTKMHQKSSPSMDVSKYEKNPTENRKNQPGFKKYRTLSSMNVMKHEKDTSEKEASWQAAGETDDRKAELDDCSKTAAFSKYTVESYSERPLDSSFKPLVIRVADTFKHHS